MKNTILNYTAILLLFITGFCSYAQDYSSVDSKVSIYPKSFASVDKLAEKINSDFKTEEDKARALFTWIATNVKYDLVAYSKPEQPVAYSFRTQEEKMIKQRKFKEELAAKTLKTKKGVCEGYATLYELTAGKMGLEAVIVPGTSKSHPTHIGKQPGASDHAWNAVKIDDKWHLIDVTWGAGTVTGSPLKFEFRFNDGYFLTDPAVFALNHYPDKEKWLLTDAVSKADFATAPLYYGNYVRGGYNFISPGTGLITITKPVLLPFRIKNLKPGDKLAYAFSKDRLLKEVQPKTDGDVAAFDIPLDVKNTGFLTIYINQRSVAAYRLSNR